MVMLQVWMVLVGMVTRALAQGAYTYGAYGDYDDYGAGAGVYDSYDETYDYEEVASDSPVFTSDPQAFSVEVGGDVTFPCHVDHLGQYVIILKKITADGSHRFLYVGENALKPAKRISKNGTSFTLRGVRRVNAGQYVCRIESSPAVELTHTLDVLYAPSLRLVTPSIQEVYEGGNVTLKCHAEGNPAPEITWAKVDGEVSEEAFIEGGILELEDVQVEDGGEYTCTADNGVTQPPSTVTTATTRLTVHYPPEVTASQSIEATEDGYMGSLSCEVKGYPPPSVTWMKGGVDASTPLPSTATLHDPHDLEIHPLRADDLGTYTCWAENGLGRANSTVHLAGILPPPLLTSGPDASSPTSYTLTWITPDDAPPVPANLYRLRLKQIHEDEEEEEEATQNEEEEAMIQQNEIPVEHEKEVEKMKKMEEEEEGGEEEEEGSASSTTAEEEEEEVVEEEEEEEWEESTYPMEESREEEGERSHVIEGLKPSSRYQVTVALKNAFAWSPESHVLEFTTPEVTTTTTTTTTVKPPREEQVVLESTSGCGDLRSRALRVVVLAAAVLVVGVVMW